MKVGLTYTSEPVIAVPDCPLPDKDCPDPDNYRHRKMRKMAINNDLKEWQHYCARRRNC